MWQAETEVRNAGNTHRIVLSFGGKALSFGETLDLLVGSEAFREFFNKVLAESPFRAFRFETPSVTSATLDQRFEFVLLSHEALDRKSDPVTFEEYFRSDLTVVRFANLRGDAILVVPCPCGNDSKYGHLGSFVRSAPEAQSQQLWAVVADAMQQRVGAKPVWLSTAGMGVSWLHVRLDDRPKYYGHADYRTAPK